MLEASKSRAMCDLHPKKPLKYYCFAKDCGNNFECCILCIKNIHKTCSENFILAQSDIITKLKEAKAISNNSIRNYSVVLKDSISQVRSFITDFMENISLSLSNKCENLGKFDSQTISSQKSSYFFDYDPVIKKIIVMSAVAPQSKNFKELISSIDKELKSSIKAYSESVKAYRINNKFIFSSGDFKHHGYLKLTDEDNKLLVNLPESNENYYLSILDKPISNDFYFKIKVSNLNPSDRYVEIGLMSSTSYNSYNTTLTGAFLMGTFCYCGYRFKGFKDSPISLALNSEKGLEENDEVFFKYDFKKAQFSIWSKKKNWKHTAKVVLTPPYYLYFSLYFNNQKFELTHL